MSRKSSKPSPGRATPPAPRDDSPPPEPVDVVDGIPDRSPRRRMWVFVVLTLVFLAWLTFLIFVQLSPRGR